MICPIMSYRHRGTEGYRKRCEGKACAWWCGDKCAMVAIVNRQIDHAILSIPPFTDAVSKIKVGE